MEKETNEIERALRHHKRKVHMLTTFAVMGAMVISFIPHEYQSLTFAANALANLLWIWVE